MYITNEDGKVIPFNYYNDDSDEDLEPEPVNRFSPPKKKVSYAPDVKSSGSSPAPVKLKEEKKQESVVK